MQPTDENWNFVETESLGKLLMNGEYFVAGGSEYLLEDMYIAFFNPKIRRGDAYVSFAPLVREFGITIDQVQLISESEWPVTSEAWA